MNKQLWFISKILILKIMFKQENILILFLIKQKENKIFTIKLKYFHPKTLPQIDLAKSMLININKQFHLYQ